MILMVFIVQLLVAWLLILDEKGEI